MMVTCNRSNDEKVDTDWSKIMIMGWMRSISAHPIACNLLRGCPDSRISNSRCLVKNMLFSSVGSINRPLNASP